MKILKSYWKSLLWAAVVLGLSTMSGQKVNEIPFMGIPNMDKVAHFTMYFIFCYLLISDTSKNKEKPLYWRKSVLISLSIAILFGGCMELLQEIPSLQRSTDFVDFTANSLGATCAALSYKRIKPFVNKVVAYFIKPGKRYSL
jgi:VanZ like family.